MRILIVSPFFPPYQSVAVVRIASLTRYLLEKGHEITVLTNSLQNSEQIDPDDSINQVEKVEINIKSAKGKYFKIKQIYIENFHRVMHSKKFDLVLITSGPYYTLSLCEISKTTYNTNCIIDFRDLWIFDIRSMKSFFRPSNLMKKITFYPIEKKAVKYADIVVTVTSGWGNILKRVYPRYKDKIKVISNGYDDNYLKKSNSVGASDSHKKNINEKKFNIISFGKLSYYSTTYSRVFFRAVKEISKEDTNINVVQVGTEEMETREILNEIGFNKESYINTGFCDYKEGMEILINANVCIIIDIRKKAIGTKIYDYIYTNKPILYVGKKNTYLSNLVSSFENGFSCQKEQQIIDVIEYIKKNNVTYLTTDNSHKKYSRYAQNKEYVNIMEEVCQGR